MTESNEVQSKEGINLILDESEAQNLKCFLISELVGNPLIFNPISPSKDEKDLIPYTPALKTNHSLIFGSNSVCLFLASYTNRKSTVDNLAVNDLLDMEELELFSCLKKKDKDGLTNFIERLELKISKIGETLSTEDSSFVSYLLFPHLISSLIFCTTKKPFKLNNPEIEKVLNNKTLKHNYPAIITMLSQVASSNILSKALERLQQSVVTNKKKIKNNNSSVQIAPVSTDDIVKPTLNEINWKSTGLLSSLRFIFDAAIRASINLDLEADLDLSSQIVRCTNSNFGDFQCNNAMGLAKSLKEIEEYTGPTNPKQIADRIIAALPDNPIISSTTSAMNGFINIKLSSSTLTETIADILKNDVSPPSLPKQKVLVDFSSPNIAKEMHVGHLRSTIIGDSICRILEFCGFDVLRVNHVGDWGTQFGMLITYLQEAFPDILSNPPNISDLTAIYKESKKRFDSDDNFKELSRNNVVKLQAHDEECKKIWSILCNISREEFEKVYKALDITLTEVGESFYNPLIPGTIDVLREKGFIQEDDGMLIIRLPHFTIPLIVRKSDGGYGYDSTDMAAIRYRLLDLNCDWIVYITDAGQATHFHMCFDVAKEIGWDKYKTGEGGGQVEKRLDHIGFGVVCGEDGKRFKTRSSETVRLIDLLNAAKEKMLESLTARVDEGKSTFQPCKGADSLEDAARVIGYGAVKYFDLKQHPSTNYIFSYDRMLDTRGDTAVYLLFAYARLNSILRKAADERGMDLISIFASSASTLKIDHPAERALAFQLMQFGDVIKSVIRQLLPNRLCEYLKELSVTTTDFVTKCHVLNADDHLTTSSRLILCEASKRVMAKCFELLGIGTLERI